jgi:hypothetical protein
MARRDVQATLWAGYELGRRMFIPEEIGMLLELDKLNKSYVRYYEAASHSPQAAEYYEPRIEKIQVKAARLAAMRGWTIQQPGLWWIIEAYKKDVRLPLF